MKTLDVMAKCIIGTFFISAIMLMSGNSWANDLYVGSGETYTTIQAAVNAAGSVDTIHVKQGVYRETVTINKSNITLKAGEGDEHKAIITGAVPITGWAQATGPDQVQGNSNWQNIYIANVGYEVKQLFRPGERLTPSRYGEEGTYIFVKAPFTNNSFYINSDKGAGYFMGGIVHIRPGMASGGSAVWRIGHHAIADFDSSGKITLKTGQNSSYPIISKSGYFITNVVGEIKQDGEWAYKDGKVYLMFLSGTPENIEASYRDYGILVNSGGSQAKISGFVIDKINKAGINITGSNVEVENNIISYSFIYGIYITNCAGKIITGNSINYCHARGIEVKNVSGTKITGNDIYAIGTDKWRGDLIGENSGGFESTGIRIVDGPYTEVAYNRIKKTGYNGLGLCSNGGSDHSRGTNTHHNYIRDVMLSLDDGAGIYIDVEPGNTPRETLDHNIIINSWGNLAGTSYNSNGSQANGIYPDDKPKITTNIDITKNTVVNAGLAGMFIHENSGINVRDNTFYSSRANQVYITGYGSGSSNNILENNIYFSTDSSQKIFYCAKRWDNFQSNHNTIHTAGAVYPMTFLAKDASGNFVSTPYTISDWQKIPGPGKEINSVIMPGTTPSQIYINPGKTAKFYSFPANSYDIDGNPITSFTLDPYESKIIFNNSGLNEAVIDVTENPGPSAVIKVNPIQGKTPLTVNFDGSDSTGPNTIVSYRWDFGDGVVDTSRDHVTHVYSNAISSPVTYKASLTVTDSQGLSAEAIVDIEVSPQEIEAVISAIPAQGESPLTVSFDGSGSTGDNTIVSYEWDLDNDGTFETSGKVVSRQYNHDMTSAVTCTVTLKVTDDQQLTDTATIDIEVSPRDTDDDNLPDIWEMQYFSDLSQCPGDDPDGDGFTNLEEFNQGTDPTHFDETPPDLMLWMKFEGNAQDSSTLSNHGSFQGNATTVFDAEMSSNVLVLDGSGDYVQVPNSSSLNITGPMTIALWVKINSAPGWFGMLSKGDNDQKQNNYQMYAAGLADVRWQTWTPNGNVYNTAKFGTLNLGQWYHLTGVYDGTNVMSYLDGQPIQPVPVVNPTQVVNQPLDIGKWAYYYLNGRMDDVRIYNRALSENEIKDVRDSRYMPAIESIVHPSPPPGDSIAADFVITGRNFGSYSGDANYNPDADTDRNGYIDHDDYLMVVNNFRLDNPNPDADITCDGKVDYEDYKIILQTFGSTRGANYVKFQNGVSAKVISWTDTEIRCIIPKKAVSGNTVVVTDRGESNPVYFDISEFLGVVPPSTLLPEITPPVAKAPSLLEEIVSDVKLDLQPAEDNAQPDIIKITQEAGFVPIDKGLTNAYYIDNDGDGYGIGNRAPNGADADDNDPEVNIPDSVIAKYGTLDSFLRTAKGYFPNWIFYIALDGDNATAEPNNINKPYRTLSSSIKEQLTGNDIVMYRGGAYVSDYGIGTSYPTVTGTEGNPIVFMAYPGEKVTFYSAENGIDCNNSSYLIFDGVVLDNDNPSRYGNGVYTYDIEHIIFRNIESLNHTRGFVATHMKDVLIENCVIHDNPGSHGFYLNSHQRTSENVTVRGCISYRNGRHGIQYNGRVTNLVIENNIFHSNTLGGVSLLMGVSDSFVRNNLIFNNDKQGIVFYLYDSGVDWAPTADQNNNIVENNLIWVGRYEWENNGRMEPGNTETIHFNDSTASQSHSMSGNIIRNNVLVTYCGPTFSFYQSRLAYDTTIENNLIYRLGNEYSNGPDRILAIGPDFATCYGFAGFEAYSDLFYGNTFADPKLTDVSVDYFAEPGRFNFDYLSDSPAINYVGINEAASVDLRWNIRDSYPDAGCYEYGGVPAPLTITTSGLTDAREGDSYD